MKPTRIGKPYTVTDHGKTVIRVYVWFPNGTRQFGVSDKTIADMMKGKTYSSNG